MSETLSEAVHATQRVQLAIDLAKLKARQAQVVQAKRVWADGQRFLFNMFVEEATSSGLTLVVNWPSAAPRIIPP